MGRDESVLKQDYFIAQNSAHTPCDSSPVENCSSRESFFTRLTNPSLRVTMNLLEVTLERILVVEELLTPMDVVVVLGPRKISYSSKLQ